MNALTNTTSTPVDWFEFDDGEDSSTGAEFAKFDGAAMNKWHGRIAGAALKLGPYIVSNLFPEIVRWRDRRIVERILPGDGKPFPKVDALNDAIPQSEWEEDPFTGAPKGPYIKNSLHVIDPETGAKVICSNSTVGQRIAYQALKERTRFMRRFKGEHVYPRVMLSSVQMRTGFVIKLAPHFEILDFQACGAPPAPAIAAPVAPVIAPAAAPIPDRKVAPPTAAEITGDEIPDHPAPKKARQPANNPDDGFPAAWANTAQNACGGRRGTARRSLCPLDD